MYYLVLLLGLIIAYLSGSVSYARIFSKIGKDIDITTVGNGNPGTSNVMREVGKGWGTLTILGDSLKGATIMLLFKWLFFSTDPVFRFALPFEDAGYIATVLIGIAAIYGHGYPLYYHFKGGGSVGVLFGCWLFMYSPQFLICIVVSYIIVKLFLSNKIYPMGRMTPLVFIVLMPFYLLVESFIASNWQPVFTNSILFDHMGWGNHFLQLNGNGWLVIAGIFLFAISVIPTNLSLLKNEILAKEKKTEK